MNTRKMVRISAITLAAAAFALAGYSRGYAEGRAALPSVERVLTQALDDVEGREVRFEVVSFPPGASAPGHRHPGHVFVYVLEGQIESQLDDGPVGAFDAGTSFYEPTNGLHAVTRNPSDSEPAKILAVMIMDEKKPSLVFERRGAGEPHAH